MKTGVDFSVADLVASADSRIPTFRGVKFTCKNLDDMQIALSHKFTQGESWRIGQPPDILYGRDQWLLAATAYGVEGAVGTSYNFNAELQAKVLNAPKDIATAQRAQLATSTFIKVIVDFDAAHSGFYSWKMAMEMMGYPVGPPRLPYIEPSQEATTALRSMVHGWCKATDEDLRPTWCNVL